MSSKAEGGMRTVGVGFHWNDLSVGERFRTVNRTITEADIVQFIGVTGMVETLFADLTFHEKHGVIKGRVSPAALVYTIIEGLLCQATMQTTGLALLEVEIKVLSPGARRRHHPRRGRGDRPARNLEGQPRHRDDAQRRQEPERRDGDDLQRRAPDGRSVNIGR